MTQTVNIAAGGAKSDGRTKRLPQFARELLAGCPSAGAGVHNWLFRAARVLHAFYPDKQELALALEAGSAGCGREVPEKEIVDAILSSARCAWKPGQRVTVTAARTATWPTYDRDLAEDIYEEVSFREYPRSLQFFDRDSLVIRSAVAAPDQLHAATLLRLIHSRSAAVPADCFHGREYNTLEAMRHDGSDPLLCAGTHKSIVGTGLLSEWDAGVRMPLPGRRRDSLLHLDDLQFVVPNAMRAEEGVAKKGTASLRCRDNAAQHRRFVIVEFDQDGDEAIQPALLWHLRELAPLVMCVDSGRRSIHGWFYVQPQTEEWQRRFFRYAVTLGADSRMWLPEQFARMPNGTRRDESGTVIAKQPVIYFDPLCMVDGKEGSHAEVC
jgi:hypothetical protein